MVIVVEESTECVPLFQTPQPPFAEADVYAWDCCYNWLDCFAFKNFDDGPSIARKCVRVGKVTKLRNNVPRLHAALTSWCTRGIQHTGVTRSSHSLPGVMTRSLRWI